jgi:hypothetical protein
MPTLDDIVAAAPADNRVCPMPKEWNELWDMLPEKKRLPGQRSALLPIPVAWEATPDEDKRERFIAHLRYAKEQGVLEQVAAFLSLLPWEQWHYEDD